MEKSCRLSGGLSEYLKAVNNIIFWACTEAWLSESGGNAVKGRCNSAVFGFSSIWLRNGSC